MKSWLLFAAVFVGQTALVFAPAKAADMQKALAPIVQLDRNCSGSLIYSDRDEVSGEVETLILTAKHCVADKAGRITEIHIPHYDKHARVTREDVYKAKVFAQAYSGDLALLKLVDTDAYFPGLMKLAPRDTPIVMGSDAWVIGYPKGLTLTVTKGLLGAMEYIPFPDSSKDTEYLRATPAVSGGNSGGALVIESAGEFVQIGVTSAGFRDAPHVSYFVTLEIIWDFLERQAPKQFPKPVTTAAKASGG